MKCDKCGSDIDINSKFCSKCGNGINEQKVEDILINDNKSNLFKIIMIIIVLIVVGLIVYYYIVGKNSDYSIVGNWKCADYVQDVSLGELDYYFTFIFSDDNKFQQKKIEYDFLVTGTYSVKNIDVTNKYAVVSKNVYLDVDYIRIDGAEKSGVDSLSYEFGFMDRDSAILINTQNYNTYVCKK